MLYLPLPSGSSYSMLSASKRPGRRHRIFSSSSDEYIAKARHGDVKCRGAPLPATETGGMATLFPNSSDEEHGDVQCRGAPQLATETGGMTTMFPQLSPLPDVPPGTWADDRYQKAARHVLHDSLLESIESASSRCDVKPDWFRKLVVAAAGLTMECHRDRWRRLLSRLRDLKTAGSIDCIRFTWMVMSDETPTRNRVQFEQGTRQPDVHHQEVDSDDLDENAVDVIVAKVMAVRVRFSMLVAENPDGSVRPVGDNGGAPLPAEVGRKLFILRGAFLSRLRAMESQTAPVVAQVLREESGVWDEPVVRELFRDVHRVDCTDLHPSMLAATKALAIASAPAWKSAHVRCSVHRLRTSELSALSVDSEVDSFWMHVTLLLQGTGVLDALRVKAREWAAQRFVIRQGSPPVEVVAWREATVGLMRSRLAAGHGTFQEVLMLHSWDTCFTGDGRKTDCVEHYHGPHCACDDEACRRRCLGAGLSALLHRAPQPYSRRTWHGHVRAVDGIILLASVHGLLRLVGGLPKKRRRAVAVVPPGLPLVEQPGLAGELFPSREGNSNGMSAQDGAAAVDAEEDERQRMRSVCSFLEAPGSQKHMLRYRDVMSVYGEARGPVLTRAGPEWDVSQMCLIEDTGQRAYHPTEASEASDALRAAARMSFWQGLPAATVWQTLSPVATFSMLTRAAASLHELVVDEQRHYPFKLWSCLVDADVVADVLHDAKSQPHVLDPVAQEHLARYPTKEGLVSRESMACLESTCLIVPETTQNVEHGHALVKRGQRGREQTHKENVAIASAMRVLQASRHDVDLLVPRRWLSTSAGGPRPVARRRTAFVVGRPKAKAAATGRRRKISTYQAWLALAKPGHLAGARESATYKHAIAQSVCRRRCQEKAAEMTALARAGITQERLEDPRLRRLRRQMQHKGKGTLWSPSVGKAIVRKRGGDPYWSSREARRREWLGTRKRRHENKVAEDGRARNKARVLQIPAMLTPFASHVVAHQSEHADAAFWWCPDVRPDVERQLPGAMAAQQSQRLIEWEKKHVCVMGRGAARLHVEPAAEKRIRQCRQRGVCLCSKPKRHAFLINWRRVMGKLLRKTPQDVASLRGPNEFRSAFSSGQLVVKTENSQDPSDARWHHISFARLGQFRAMLLELSIVAMATEDPCQPGWQAASPSRRIVAQQHGAETRSAWRFAHDRHAFVFMRWGEEHVLTLWRLARASWPPDGEAVLLLQPMLGSRRVVWDGARQRIPKAFPIEQPGEEDEEEGGDDGDQSEESAPREVSDHEDGSGNQHPAAERPKPRPSSGAPSKHGGPIDPADAVGKKGPAARTGSQQGWVGPVVPGHGGQEAPAGLIECSLNRISRSSAQGSQWVARCSGKQMDMTKAKKDSRLKNKTRSQTYHSSQEEHNAWRVTLLWLWRRFFMAGGRKELPEQVRRALAPMDKGELVPCPECRAGTCTFMELAAAGLLVKIASEGSSGATQPAAKCVFCGGEAVVIDQVPACRLCREVDAEVARGGHANSRPIGQPRAHQITLSVPESFQAGGPGWQMIMIPPDGNCLFGSFIVGKLCFLDRKRALPEEPAAQAQLVSKWAASCRKHFVTLMHKRGEGNIDEVPMAEVIRASTGMSTAEYLDRMSKPIVDRSSWGGFMEASIMAVKWRCRIVFFGWEPDQRRLRSWSHVGDDVNSAHRDRGRIAVAWTGTHFNLLVLDEGVLARLP